MAKEIKSRQDWIAEKLKAEGMKPDAKKSKDKDE